MKTFLLIVAVVSSAGCSAPLPTIQTGAEAADAAAPVPDAAYVPVTAGTVHYSPVEPKSWRGMNERVAPRRTQ